MITNTRRTRGFTLIELLVVVLILGILLAIAIPTYLSSVVTSRSNTAMSNAKTIASAVQAAYVKNAGAKGYDVIGDTTAHMTTEGVVADLSGSVPPNPCDGNGTAVGPGASWDTTGTTAGHYEIKAKVTNSACTGITAITLN